MTWRTLFSTNMARVSMDIPHTAIRQQGSLTLLKRNEFGGCKPPLAVTMWCPKQSWQCAAPDLQEHCTWGVSQIHFAVLKSHQPVVETPTGNQSKTCSSSFWRADCWSDLRTWWVCTLFVQWQKPNHLSSFKVALKRDHYSFELILLL